MKQINLSGTLREGVGKRVAKDLRNEGVIPAVIYGGEKALNISLNKKEVAKAIFTPEVFQVILAVDGKTYSTVIRETQFHPVTDEILHIDFLEVDDKKPVRIKLPVRITGQSRGVKAGGKLLVHFRKIDVKGIPSELPDEVKVDITPLRIGQNIRVRDVQTDALRLLIDPNAVIVAVAPARGAAIGSDAEVEA